MNPEQARSIRFKKRLEEQLDPRNRDQLDNDDDEKSTRQILREQEKKYREEEKEFGKADYEKTEYFGYRIEPFSMKEERETGIIHEDGYVEISKKKERQNRDAWLDSLEEVEDPRAKLKRPLKEDISDNDEPNLDPKERFHLTKELYDLLQSGETPNHALNRLRPAQARPQKKTSKNVRKAVKTENNSEQYNALDKGGKKTEEKDQKQAEKAEYKENEDDEKKKTFDRIIEICDILVGNGYMEVFTDTRERIQNKFMRFEDELIQHDLEDEGKVEDMNPDHNVIEE